MLTSTSARAVSRLLAIAGSIVALALGLPERAGAAAAQDTTPPIQLVHSTHEILPRGASVTVWAPITFRSGLTAADFLQPVVDSVRLGNVGDGALIALFTAALVASGNGREPAIELTVQLQPPMRVGTYDVELLLRRVKPNEPPARVVIQVAHPSAQLRPPGTVVIEDVRWNAWRTANRSGQIELYETSHKSHLTNLTATQTGAVTQADVPVTGRIRFDGPFTVPPAGKTDVTYALVGRFPLGTSKATIELSAPQLSSALSVPMEIRTRLHPLLILPVILAGLLLGYGVRVWLRRKIEVREKQLQSLDLAARMEQETRRREDAVFVRTVGELLGPLRAAARLNDPKKINEALTAADAGLRKALQEFTDRRTALLNVANDRLALTTAAWSLPESLQTLITEIRGAVDDALAAIRDNRLDVADKTLKQRVAVELARRVADDADRWQRTMAGGLRPFAPATKLLTPLTARSDALVGPIMKALAAIPVGEPNLDLGAILRAVHASRFSIHRDVLNGLAFDVQGLVNDILGVLPGDSPPVVTAVREQARQFTEALAAARDRTEDLPELTSQLAQLDSGFRRAIEDVAAKADTDTRKTVEQKLQSGQYLDAAVAASAKPAGPAATTWSGAGPSYPSTPAVSTVYAPPLPPLTAVRIIDLERPSDPIEIERARTLRELITARLAEFVVTTLGISLVGYLLFQPKFVGTFPDLAAVFFWGFAADVSLNALVESAKSAGKPR